MANVAEVRTLLTTDDVARRAGVSRALVKQWVIARHLRAVAVTPSRMALFDPAAVDAWLAEWGTKRRRPYRVAGRVRSVEGLDYAAPRACCEVPPSLGQ